MIRRRRRRSTMGRAQKRALRAEIERVAEIAKQSLRAAIEEGLIEGRIEGDGTIVIVETSVKYDMGLSHIVKTLRGGGGGGGGTWAVQLSDRLDPSLRDEYDCPVIIDDD